MIKTFHPVDTFTPGAAGIAPVLRGSAHFSMINVSCVRDSRHVTARRMTSSFPSTLSMFAAPAIARQSPPSSIPRHNSRCPQTPTVSERRSQPPKARELTSYWPCRRTALSPRLGFQDSSGSLGYNEKYRIRVGIVAQDCSVAVSVACCWSGADSRVDPGV